MKSFIKRILGAALVVFALSSAVYAESENGITCSINGGVFYVSGSGDVTAETIENYINENSAELESVTAIEIGNGIISVEADAFVNCGAAISAKISSSVTSIGDHAFGYTTEDKTSYTKVEGFTVKSVKDSCAETWANDNGFEFEEMPAELPSGNLGNVKWEISETGVLTFTGNGIIPSYTSGEEAPWSEYYSSESGFKVVSVVISDGITSIGDNAFSSPNGITSFDIHSTVRHAGQNAFSGCVELKSFSSSSIQTMGDGAFCGCQSLETANLGAIVTISASAFDGTPIKSITVSSSCVSIGSGAFRNCKNLSAVSMPCVTVIGNAAFEDCSALATVSFGKLNSIGDYAFCGCSSLGSFTFGDSLTYIGCYAFSGCKSISSVTISRGVTVIQEGVFEGCEGLTTVSLSDTVTEIQTRAFANCQSLKTVTVTKNLRKIAEKSIGYYYYSEEKIEGIYGKYTDYSLVIKAPTPSAAKNYAEANGFDFQSTGNVSTDSGTTEEGITWTVKLPAGTILVSGTGDMKDYSSASETPWAVYAGSIKAITLTGVTRVGAYSFDGFTYASIINIPSTVLTIGRNAFSGTAVETVTFPSGLTDIGDSAFEGCSSLASVSMPLSLKNIGENCFKATRISSVYIPSSVEFIGTNAIGFNSLGEKIQSFLIKGSAESVAQYYAEENGLSFRVDGYVKLSDPVSGASVNLIGSDEDSYDFSVTQISTSIDGVFLSSNEYVLVYRPSLTTDGAEVILDGTATVSLPVPDGVKALLVKLYKRDTAGNFEAVLCDVSDGSFVYSTTALDDIIISNAELTDLYKITVLNVFEDGSPASDEYVYYASNTAQYEISSLTIDGFAADTAAKSGRVEGGDITLTFTYIAVETQPTDETSADDTDDTKPVEKETDVIFIVEIGLIVVLFFTVIVLMALLIRRRRINETEETSEKRFTTEDRFGDTIVVPHADDGELDIAALFGNDEDDDMKIAPENKFTAPPIKTAEKPAEPPKKAADGAKVSRVSADVIRKRFRGTKKPKPRRTISQRKQ